MNLFGAFSEVTTWIGLLAFLTAVVGFVVSRSLERDRQLIEKAQKEDRSDLVQTALNRLGRDAEGLTKEQRFELLKERVRQRRLPWIVVTILAFFITVIIIVSLLVNRDSERPRSSSEKKPVSQRNEEKLPDSISTTKKTLVLVADFDGPEPQKYRIKDAIIDQLQADLQAYKDVEVQSLRQVFTAGGNGSRNAREEGSRLHAAMIIWGWYSVTPAAVPISVHLELLKDGFALPSCGSKSTGFQTASLSDLINFKLQSNLSKEASYMTLIATGMARYASGDWAGAATRFSDALSRSNMGSVDPGAVHVLRGNAYYYEHNTFGAVYDYGKALSLGKYPGAHYGLGVVYAQRGELKSALEEFNRTVDQAPEYEMAVYWRGLVSEKLGLLNAALGDYSKALALNTDTVVKEVLRDGLLAGRLDCKKLASEASPHPLYLYLCGDVNYSRGNFDSAVKHYKKIIEVQPSAGPAYRRLGDAFLERNMYDASLPFLEKAVELEPERPCTFASRGRLSLMRNDYSGAEKYLSRAIDLDPSFGYAYLLRGVSYEMTGDKASAMRDYSEVINMSPEDPYAYLRRASLSLSSNRREEALADLAEVGELGFKVAEEYAMRARLYERLGNYPAAEADFSRAAALDSKEKANYVSLASLYLRRASLREALGTIRKALALDPDDEYARSLERSIIFTQAVVGVVITALTLGGIFAVVKRIKNPG